MDQGLGLVRGLQPDTRRFGYHLCIGGGVVNKGRSEKDLDLYFLPLDNNQVVTNPDGLVNWLVSKWGEADPIGGTVDPEYGNTSAYTKKLKFWTEDGRIDVFIV